MVHVFWSTAFARPSADTAGRSLRSAPTTSRRWCCARSWIGTWNSAGEVDEVVLGCANQAGEDNRNVARMALLLAGLPETVPGVTVNRLCGSGLDALDTPLGRSAQARPM